ncbi:MAG: glycosyltransferase [Bacteroidetes bacterium]|jgi:glycosyltransferase involved in cell wall biosynthesis|nr:glycosyltransferase [Bacteroidota bacterium]
MRILINTASTFKGGGVQVAESFINECKFFTKNEYHVILGEKLSTRINQDSFPENFKFYSAPFRPGSKVFSLSPADSFHKKIEKECNPEVVFTTSGPSYWRPNVPHLIGYNLPHYIYPESPAFSQMGVIKKMKWEVKGRILKYFFDRDAEAYVVQTDDVNERLGGWLNNNKAIYTVTNTCSTYYLEHDVCVENKLPKKQDGEFRLLTLSAFYPHKNIGIIKQVIPLLPERIKSRIRFVTTLPDDIFNELFNTQEREYIYNLGFVPMSECPSLYGECDAMFLPTLLECFSASYPEAMAMKKPILTSNLGFAKTVCGSGAVYFDPISPNDIAQKILDLLTDLNLQESLIYEGEKRLKAFDSPKRRAEKFLNICQQLIEN